jgi:hypothetical protein
MKHQPLITANFCLNRFKLTLENNEKDRSGFKIKTNKFVINCTKYDDMNEQTPYDTEIKMAVRSAFVYSMYYNEQGLFSKNICEGIEGKIGTDD